MARLLIAISIATFSFASSVSADSGNWSYQGETGPSHWQEMEQGSHCAGSRQSPINIIRKDSEPDTSKSWNLSIHYNESTHIHSVVNNGHTIKYDFDEGDDIEFRGARFTLKQIHFHEPAEHTINGIRYPIELHLVHYNQTLNRYAVLAVLGREGETSDAYELLEAHLPLKSGEEATVDKPFDLNLVLPSNVTPRFHYEGSLTTPPCSENVNWVIFEQPFVLSEDQVVTLKNNMPLNNYRDTQQLNDRHVSLVVH